LDTIARHFSRLVVAEPSPRAQRVSARETAGGLAVDRNVHRIAPDHYRIRQFAVKSMPGRRPLKKMFR
jgi:hypothetical protein